MKIEVNDSIVTTNTIVTVDFQGSIDFKLNEDGTIRDGHKTMTHQEFYDAIKPIEEEVKSDEAEEFTSDINLAQE